MSSASVLTRPAVAARVGTAAVIPPTELGSASCWRRLVTAVDRQATGAFALTGQNLEPGARYELPRGALVIACDKHTDGVRTVRLLRADDDALREIKAWDLKAALGKRVVDYTARRLDPGSARHTATALEALPNRFAGRCARCHNPVAARAGILVHQDGRNRVAHRDGQCPPAPARRNLFAGACARCGGWIEPGAGLLEPPADILERHLPVHDGACPPVPAQAPVRPNEFDGWCRGCGQFVPARAGRWERGIRHLGTCPVPQEYHPTWRVYRRCGQQEIAAGQVFLARLGLSGRGGCPAPVDAPGFRVLAEDWIEFAAVALECARTGSGRQAVRVRAATWTEAEDVLAGQMRLALDACPVAGGFRGLFQAELIGPSSTRALRIRLGAPDYSRPWLAEITGRDRCFGYERRFLRSRLDFSGANRKGTRGVVYAWTLKPNRIYQAQYPQGRDGVRRVFLRTTPEGDVREITAAQVEAFLNAAPEWLLMLGETPQS